MRYKTLLAFGGTLCAFSQPASAQLTGQGLTAEWWYPSQGTVFESHDVVVDSSVELTADTIINDSKYELDIGADYVEFRFILGSNWQTTSFNGWAFTDTLGVLPPFRGYSIDSFSSGVTGIGTIVTGFTDDEFWCDFSGGLSAPAGSWIRLAVDVEPIGSPYCATNVNSTGVAGALSGSGSRSVASNTLTLLATNLPANASTLFMASQVQGFVANPAGSSGNLCLGGNIGRYSGPGEVQVSDAGGAVSLAVDLTQTPTGSGPAAVAAGQTWNFQAWHRDLLPSGTTTSNLTNGLSITFN